MWEIRLKEADLDWNINDVLVIESDSGIQNGIIWNDNIPQLLERVLSARATESGAPHQEILTWLAEQVAALDGHRTSPWQRAYAADNAIEFSATSMGEQVEAPAQPQTPSYSQPLQAGTGQGGTANGVPESNNQSLVDYLASGGTWYFPDGGSTPVLTYGFPTSNGFASGFSERSGWSAFAGTQEDAARLSISLWDDLIPVTFVEADGNTADLKFSNTTGSGYAHAWSPGIAGNEETTTQRRAGSLWFNPAFDETTQSNDLVVPTPNSHGFATYVHEIGHSLGLQHAGDYNGGSPAYGDGSSGWLFVEDSQQYTIMSYFDADNTGADWGYNLTWSPWLWENETQTPMVYDILAIQQKYGADYTTRAGDTVYGFNSNAGGTIYDFDNNATPILTIWDGAGIDTIDLSGWSTRSSVSLVAGSYSSTNGLTHNIAIAFDVDIENAIGGSAADILIGNDLDNILTGNLGSDYIVGNGGNDTIYGGHGFDTLEGGEGNDTLDGGFNGDTLDGGAGFDWVSYRSAFLGVITGLESDAQRTGDAANDIYVSIEGLEGSDFDDILSGDGGLNFLSGGAGNDVLFGAGGNDALIGGDGADHLDGGDGYDSANYYSAETGLVIDLTDPTNSTGDAAGDTHSNIEIVDGSRFADIITGDGTNQWLYGHEGDDNISGGDGSDVLIGGAGGDVLNGGSGYDSASYYSAGAGVTVDWADPLNNLGDAAGDTFFGIEIIDGSKYADSITGDAANNYLYGHGGDDFIDGGSGGDFILGGSGNDTLLGGSGADRFVFKPTETGSDSVVDFENGLDLLNFSAFGFASADDVLALAVDSGSDMTINLAPDVSVLVANFQVSQFDMADFVI